MSNIIPSVPEVVLQLAGVTGYLVRWPAPDGRLNIYFFGGRAHQLFLQGQEVHGRPAAGGHVVFELAVEPAVRELQVAFVAEGQPHKATIKLMKEV